MKKIALLFIFLTLIISNSCTDAKVAKLTGLGNQFIIEVYSGDKLIKQYTSTGKVKSSKQSDGYYFMDEKTKKLVEVCGTIVITQK